MTLQRLLSAGLALLAILWLAACQTAPGPGDSTARVTIRPDPAGVTATFSLPHAVEAFAFDNDAGDTRTDSWSVATPGAELTENTITLATPASTFEIALTSDTQQRDRIYPALTPVGGGWQIYAPHLAPAEDSGFSFDMAFDLPDDWTIVGHRDAAGKLTLDGWIYVGPAKDVERGAADVVTDPTTPPWLRQQILEAANEAAALFEDRLGVRLASKPGIVIGYYPVDPSSGMRGDVTPGAMMSVRFYGAGWATASAESAAYVREFLAHEIFHFWNGGLVDSSENAERPWLHEGGASYAAILALDPTPDPMSRALLDNLNDNFTQCQSTLKEQSLMDGELRSNRAPYVCGVILQWAWDAGLRTMSGNTRDVLSLWRDVIADARIAGGLYSVDSTLRRVPPEAAQAASILLQDSGPERWTAFADAMRRYGAVFTLGRNTDEDRADALMSLMRAICVGRHGYYTRDAYLTLDTEEGCGSLTGAKDFDAVAGHNATTDASAMYDRMREICENEGVVDFTLKGAVVASATCKTRLPPPRLYWTITRAFNAG